MSGGKDSKISGGLGSIGLHDRSPLLGMNHSTTTLVLGRQGHEGKIYFKTGNVVHAFAGELEGPEAFAELLKWQDADFMIEEGIPTLSKVTISESAVGLMLSSMTRIGLGLAPASKVTKRAMLGCSGSARSAPASSRNIFKNSSSESVRAAAAE